MKYAVSLLAFVLVLAAPEAWAEPHRSERGNVFVSDGLERDAVVPVVIVEGGLAEDAGALWPLLSARTKLVLVETPRLRSLLGRPESGAEVARALEGALAEAAKHHEIARCPWVVVAFSRAAPHLIQLVLSDPERFQGLVIANGSPPAQALLVDRTALDGFEVLILNSAEDPVSPLARAKALGECLKEAGARVADPSLPTDDHLAPVGEAGVQPILSLISRAAARSVTPRPLDRPWKRVETKSADGLLLTADLYDTGNPKAPIVLLFHQARSSRGEYRPIARRLVRDGYNCLALDARSGAQWAGVLNETAARAKADGKPATYVDARPDLERAVAWARELGFEGKMAVWGSSYSAALVMFVGGNEEVAAVLAFSPGDFLTPRGSTLEAATVLTKPVLIVCPPGEETQARSILERVAGEEKSLYVHPAGLHGSRTLYVAPDPGPAWKKVLAFMEAHLFP